MLHFCGLPKCPREGPELSSSPGSRFSSPFTHSTRDFKGKWGFQKKKKRIINWICERKPEATWFLGTLEFPQALPQDARFSATTLPSL